MAQPALPKDKSTIVYGMIVIFIVTLGVRLLCWHDVRLEVRQVQSAVTANYKTLAHLLIENGPASFFDPESSTSDPDLLGHPPGYPIFLAAAYKVFGESDDAIQILQIIADAFAAVIIFLIASELLPKRVAVFTGLLAALSPQFSWNSVMLLPDSLAILPLLVALLLLVRAHNREQIWSSLAAGVLVGISCWLRANSLLLAPFLLLAIPLLFKKGLRTRPALGLLIGAIIAIAPLTIRNAVVFHHFIPLSLGAGQTLIEGIADFDRQNSFGFPKTDKELTEQEAVASGRPDYASALFTPDGIERDRARVQRAFGLIRAHPVWFAGVMIQRATSMVRLERTPVTSTAPVTAGVLHYPRLVLRLVQKLFITAVFLPLVIIGLIILVRLRSRRALAVIAVLPAYYFVVQSVLHTEYRYVLATDYFLFVLAAVALHELIALVERRPTNQVQAS